MAVGIDIDPILVLVGAMVDEEVGDFEGPALAEHLPHVQSLRGLEDGLAVDVGGEDPVGLVDGVDSCHCDGFSVWCGERSGMRRVI